MYYRITDHVALRSWSDIGFAIYKRGIRKPFPLSEKLAATMLLADGEHDMETDDTVMLLVMRGLIEPCEKGKRCCCNCTHTMVAVTSEGEVMPCTRCRGSSSRTG